MRRSSTPSYILELELNLTKEQADQMDRLFKVARQTYNRLLNEALKRLHKVQHDHDIQVLLKELKTTDKDDKVTRNHIYSEIRTIERSYGYSEFDLHAFAAEVKHYFHDVLGIDECQKLATRAFRAVEKVHYHEANKVRFKAWHKDMSIEGKSNSSTVRHNEKNGTIYVKGFKEGLPYIVKCNDLYAMHALRDRTKYVRILTRTIRGKKRYFVQLVQEGLPPSKTRKPGNDRVGLDIGVSTLMKVSHTETKIYELAPSAEQDERKIHRIQRAMDRSKRATNPDNYNPDGTIKPRKQLKKWNFSKRYIRLRSELRDVQRRAAAKRKQDHEMLANRIVQQGLDIRVEDMKIKALQKKAKTSHKRNDGRNSSRKRFGKVIKRRAPSMLLSIIDRKLHYYGSELKHIDTWKVKASQYNHITGTYEKKPLKQRYADVGGHRLQRDLYSAFLVRNTTNSLDTVDTKLCNAEFDDFVRLQDKEVENVKQNGTKALLWYVGYAI